MAAGWFLCRTRSREAIAAGLAEAADSAKLIEDRDARIEALRSDAFAAQRTIARMEGEATRVPELREELASCRRERQVLEERFQSAQQTLAETSADLANERRQSIEKLALLAGAREDLTNQFKTLANDILEEKSKRFTAENQASMGHLLDPLKTRLTEFQAKVEEVQKEGIAGRSELKTHIGELKSLNERLSSDATNLANALKGSSKTQGDWGESILELTLNACGLRKGHHYRVQESFDGESGRGRPDVIVDLPGGHHLVIDSKVSLLDYHDYCKCNDENQRKTSLGRHMSSVRNHVKDLSKRNYQQLYKLKSLDFVVMFVPIEPAFMLAIAGDQKLWEEAWNKSILLVSHSTLLFVLRMVANLQRQEKQDRQVQAIVDRGCELYDKLAAFAEDLSKVGVRLNSARDSYDEAVKKLSTGKGSAIRQAEMLKELGVKPSKNMPLSMSEAAMDDHQPLLLESLTDVNADYFDGEVLTGGFRAHVLAGSGVALGNSASAGPS